MPGIGVSFWCLNLDLMSTGLADGMTGMRVSKADTTRIGFWFWFPTFWLTPSRVLCAVCVVLGTAAAGAILLFFATVVVAVVDVELIYAR